MPSHTATLYRALFVGLETQVPLLDGSYQTYINLDNAASTPALKPVQQAVNSFLPYYSSVHRGTGFKSQLSTHAYEQARQSVLKFLDANPDEHTCIFGKNTTEAINKLSRRLTFKPGRDIVLVTTMEHHSNDLPWRPVAKTIHIKSKDNGQLDEADYDDLLARYGQRIALVAVTGASNVTGFLNPLHRLARKAHAVGAVFLADCAQLAPHRKVEMGSLHDPDHLDFVAISAHKMYAPFGTGALVGRKDIFEAGDPDQRGGGTVEIVTVDSVVWAEPPDKDEAGSPNTVGAVALSAAIHQLTQIGMENVASHEAELTAYALHRLAGIPGIRVYGDSDPQNAASRLGVIPFEVQGISHFKVAAILGYEFGIGVRSGCFCAHPYILHLLGLTSEEANAVRQRMLAHDRSDMPGLVRASFGLYNTFEEVDTLIHALQCIIGGDYRGQYDQDATTGEFIPRDWKPDFDNYFNV